MAICAWLQGPGRQGLGGCTCLGSEEVHVFVGGIQQLLRRDWVDDGQDLGVGALAEEADGAVRAAGDDGHAPTVGGEVHDVEYLEGGLHPQQPHLHPILCAVHELKAQLLTALHQRHLIRGWALQDSEILL